MTGAELKEALISGKPVLCDTGLVGELKFERVSAIIYRIMDGELVVSAELSSRGGRSVTVVLGKNIKMCK